MAVRRGGISEYERLRRVQAVTDVALRHVAIDELFDELLERIRDALEADTCAILLLDEDRNELVARAAKGIEEEVELGVRIPVGKGFAGRVAAERRPVILAEVNHANVLNPILREKGIRSLLGAPLLTRGRVLGIVHVGTLTPREFTEEDVALLELIAERAALGVERGLLHDELLRLDKVKHDFIVTAAHELRAPAAVIYGVATTFAEHRESLNKETVGELFDTFYDAAVRLAQLTEDLLDLSRLEEIGDVPTLEPLQIRELLTRLSQTVSSNAYEDIEIDVTEDMVILSDRDSLDRIIGNLVRNALVHGAPPVSISAVTEAGEARIHVEDRGPGISPAFLGRLFDPFARPNESEGKPGAGLGLAIARSYARRLGGDLAYEPAHPKGARFTLVLPQPS
jgi:signal transduction histidine kinase